MIVNGLQNVFGEMYLDLFSTDVLFIIANIRIRFQMNAGEFEG